ncbi:MAG: hypothetical protein MUF38_19520 [Anaerolineae bacterium]|jgi:hypothetical protein|nr:hypothetical protein [Anaerolineae bacterium]
MKAYRWLSLLAIFALSLPLFADETTFNTVTFNGFHFTYPAHYAENLSVRQSVPLEELYIEYKPGDIIPAMITPPSTEFTLTTSTPTIDPAVKSQEFIRVYRVADFADYPFHADFPSRLQALLDEQPDLTTVTLPVLPFDGIVVSTRHTYVETETLRGIRFVGYEMPIAVMSLSERSYVYYFQALSHDGQYYVEAKFHLYTEAVPERGGDNFEERFLSEDFDQDAYFAEAQTLLDNAQPSDFIPDLGLIESIIDSMEIEQ